MVLSQLCSPALIYLVFSLVHIVIDTTKGNYNTAFMKAWVALIFTVLLNYLCSRGLDIISWIIVFIPFIMMTIVITVLLYVFGLNPATGKVIVQDFTKPTDPSSNYIDARAESAKQNASVVAVKATPVAKHASDYKSTHQTPEVHIRKTEKITITENPTSKSH